MQKLKNSLPAAMLLLSCAFTSCIQDEAPNAEADITACTLPDAGMLIRTPVITNDEVKFYTNGWNDVTKLAPSFTLTEGATIEPANGTVRNFTTPQTYTVTSQDGQWKKTYKVSFISDDPVTTYHFENVKYYTYGDNSSSGKEPQKFYQIFTETTTEGNTMDWASGNAGFMITHSTSPATDYPTCQAENGVEGKCVKLETKDTGALGKIFKAPIAAGNLFTGEMTNNFLASDKAKLTHFGVPFRKSPTYLTGFYKYKAGAKVTDANQAEVKGKKDTFDVYAVFFETSKETPYLDGTNSLTSKNIVSIARLTDKKETDEWTYFSIKFQPMNGKTVDAARLKEGKYSLAIVMSSSIDGAKFIGAVGSTLYIDEMELFYE
uniref:PCMD domain-containing protein n=1 Tax=Prevotella sp. GTC17253 TaxID=3236793 RepID=A0AB33IRK9_9BACT